MLDQHLECLVEVKQLLRCPFLYLFYVISRSRSRSYTRLQDISMPIYTYGVIWSRESRVALQNFPPCESDF
jgi:hypothetical protein